MIAIVIEFTVKPECRGEFLERLRRDARETLGDPGCLRMEVLLPQSGDGRVLLSELWQDGASIEQHRNKPGHSHAWQDALILDKRVTACDVAPLSA
ncbi:MAG: antibiotic biosynthesis monooxygenase [Burkholderiales bacterium]|nr:antibiotic biosynthesis monooxygenase [Burkholderiales bacterium]